MAQFKKAAREAKKVSKKALLNNLKNDLDELTNMRQSLERMIELSKILDELYLDEESRSIICSYEELLNHAQELNSKAGVILNAKLLKLVTDNYHPKHIEEYIDRKNSKEIVNE